MKNRASKNITKQALAIAGFVVSLNASATVPWCHGGTKVEIEDVTWNESQILTHFYGSVPSGHSNPDYYKAFTASRNYANTFTGESGPFAYTVPGGGSVEVRDYAPSEYMGLATYYRTYMGVSFKLIKCYSIPMDNSDNDNTDTGGPDPSTSL